MGEEALESNSAAAINSSNKGFQLLKKHGWTEGTGLRAHQQGRLEPLQAQVKKNKRGLGADKINKNFLQQDSSSAVQQNDNEHSQSKKAKALSKKARKLKEQEEHLQEKEFERAFFREFWPDNV